MKTKNLIILIAVILIVAGAVGYCLYKTSQGEKGIGEKPESEKVSESEPEKISELKPLDETWNTYINYELGFSIKVPKEIMHSYGSCRWVDSEKSYRPEEASVPVKIFEDENNKIVYVASEYFYVLGGEIRKNYVSYFSECNKTFNSIELLELPKDGCEQSQYQHCWEIVAKDITSDKELEAFIKERYGSGCSLGEKVTTQQKGVYDIRIKGDGKDIEFTKCPSVYGRALKYYPEKNKVISWRFGIQAPTFYKDYNLGGEYDSEMIKSFSFLGIEDETAGWEIYKNGEYGYEIKYPKAWEFKQQSLISNSGHLDSVWLQSDKNSFTVNVWNFSVYSYDQLIEPPPGGIDPDTIKKTEIIIDGQPATGLSYTAVGNAGSGAWKIKEVFVQKNQLLYKIKSCDYKECDQILSTFKFIELEEAKEVSRPEEKPSITVLSPNGGEKWKIGKDYDITWASKGIDTVGVDLYKEGEIFDSLIITSADLGKCSWNAYIKTISELPGDNYKVRVFDYSNPEIYDESNKYFSIKEVCPLPETPALTDPGVSVNKHEPFTLNWTSVSGAKWYALQRGTSTDFPIGPWICEVNSDTDNPGVGTSSPEVTTTYYYRVKACNNCGCGSYSNIVDMQVIVPSITVTSPNGGESTNQEGCKIQWDSRNVELIDILLLIYDENKNQLICYHNPIGTGFTPLSEAPIATFKKAVRAEDGYYLTSFKQELEGNCSFVILPAYYKIKLRESYASETVDISDGYFTISPAPVFKIISAGDEVQLRGEINPLNWDGHTFVTATGNNIILTDDSTKFYLDGEETTFEELKQIYNEMGEAKHCPFGSCPFNSLNGNIWEVTSQGKVTIMAKEMFFFQRSVEILNYF